jgi:type II secretory pathway pseudopilin PulG
MNNIDVPVCMEHDGQSGRTGGFSLLELLCAMAILMIIVLMISTIFAESDKTWTLGTNRAENNATGRAAVNMMANDLEYAVADGLFGFRMRPDPLATAKSFGFTNSEICFVSLQNDSSRYGPRTALEMAYYVQPTNDGAPYGQRYELKRACFTSNEVVALGTSAAHCYNGTNNTWFISAGRPTNGVTLAQNVTGLGFYGPDGAKAYDSTLPASSNQLPQFVDIWLEILNDRPAAQVGQVWPVDPAQAVNILQRNVRRYTARVYFHNSYGYSNNH